MKKAIVLLAIAMSASACTSMYRVDTSSPGAIRQEVKSGQHATVVAKNGKTYDLKITNVRYSDLTGVDGDGKRHRISFASIDSIEVEKINKGKTAGTAAGVAVGSLGMISILTILLFAAAFGAL